jgi:hypothetical protein
MEWLVLLTMLGGGANDFLDIIPAEQYWQSKKVQISEKSLGEELAVPPAAGDISKLIDSLADELAANREAAARKIRSMGEGAIPQLKDATQSGNPEVAASARRIIKELQTSAPAIQVRKLMAIRAAGEQKMRGLLPRLKELQQSQERFVGDYAAAAVAAIEGKPHARPHAPSGEDVWLMPAASRAVVHVEMSVSGTAVTSEDMKHLISVLARGDPKKGEQKAQELFQKLIDIVEKTGNVRIDGITYAVSGDIGDHNGFVAGLVHGQWDAEAVVEVIDKASGKPHTVIDGCIAVPLEHVGMILFPSNQHAVLLAGPPNTELPTKEILAAIKSGKGELKAVPEMAKLLATIDTRAPLWGAVHVTDAMREAPFFKPLETITLISTQKDGRTHFKLEARGQNGPGVAGVVGMVNQAIDSGKNSIKTGMARNEEPEMKKMMQTVLEMLESIKCESDAADPKHATMTGSLQNPTMMMVLGMFGAVSTEAKPVPAAPPVAPQPIGPPPAPPPPPPG